LTLPPSLFDDARRTAGGPGLIVLLATWLSACSQPIEETAAYQAACQGPPLRTIERMEDARVNGYEVNRQFNCVDKTSHAAINAQRARQAAANTPEALAAQRAEHERRRNEVSKRRQGEGEAAVPGASPRPGAHRPVDVNTASESELAGVLTLGPGVAAEIVAERRKGRFRDWADLVNRVGGLSGAQSAVRASACGLDVDGTSLPGASPEEVRRTMPGLACSPLDGS